MAKKNFSKMTPEEIQALTGKDLDAYNAWLLKQNPGAANPDPQDEEEEDDATAAAPKARTRPAAPAGMNTSQMKAHAEDYFERHPNSPLQSIHVCSDGTIFPGTIHGKNACDNHIVGRKAQGLETTSLEVQR